MATTCSRALVGYPSEDEGKKRFFTVDLFLIYEERCILQAGGFNAVSVYIHWGLVEGKQGTLNWDYFRSLDLFYEVAKRVGIYVIARPGVSSP